jgi:hypothetical protein
MTQQEQSQLNAIKKAKNLYKKLLALENEWNVFYKNNTFNKSFWNIDKKIVNLFKEINTLPYNAYPLRTADDLLGYIEFREITLYENTNNTNATNK